MWEDFAEGANGHFCAVVTAETVEAGDEIRVDRVVAIDERDEFPSGEVETSVTGTGETTVFLVDDFDARIFFGENITKLTAHVS